MPAMSLADTVRVNGPAACAHCGPNRRALSATGESADTRAGESGPRDRQLVPMLLPEGATMINAPVTNGLRRHNWPC